MTYREIIGLIIFIVLIIFSWLIFYAQEYKAKYKTLLLKHEKMISNSPEKMRENAKVWVKMTVQYLCDRKHIDINKVTEGNAFAFFDVAILCSYIAHTAVVSQKLPSELYSHFVKAYYPALAEELSDLGFKGTNSITIQNQIEDRLEFWIELNTQLVEKKILKPKEIFDDLEEELICMVDYDISNNEFLPWDTDSPMVMKDIFTYFDKKIVVDALIKGYMMLVSNLEKRLFSDID